MKKHLTTIFVVLMFLLGVGLLIYPTFSNWWNERYQSRAIATYQEAVDDNDEAANEAILAAADAYNERLRSEREDGTLLMGTLTDEQAEEYNSLLDITGTGIMGYVKIPKIDVELPIYHGTDEAVLQIAIGHIEGTSLPVGGKGTHAVISGHRGLPSAQLFTNITNLGEGDIFIITCLNRKITYEVDQILTVLPDELDSLAIDPDEDYCTLVTCTPYGINSHRLLVRGHRIENLLDEDVETIQIDIPEREYTTQERLQQILPYILILVALFFGIALLIPRKRRPYEGRYEDADRYNGDRYDEADHYDEDRYETRHLHDEVDDWREDDREDDRDDARWRDGGPYFDEERRYQEDDGFYDAPEPEDDALYDEDEEDGFYGD